MVIHVLLITQATTEQTADKHDNQNTGVFLYKYTYTLIYSDYNVLIFNGR